MPVSRIRPMESLKLRLSRIADKIPPGSQVVYLDYPVYGNIGDLLIMQGTEAFFREHGIRVRGRYSNLQFRVGVPIPEDWIIVCQGGGNFGDLYPNCQRLRESAAETYRNHRIVVLPQTLHFQSKEEERRSLERFAEHRDFHLYVRDESSFAVAARHLENVALSPDMAHQLYPLRSGKTDGTRRLAILRTDGEASNPPALTDGGFDRITDWPQLLSPLDRLLLRLMDKACSLDRMLGNLLPIQPVWYRIAARLVAKAVDLYGAYGHVTTSRLHGHILACLMDLPNDLLDNCYGKNSGYYRLWTSQVEGTRLIEPQRMSRVGEEAALELTAGNDHRHLYPQPS